MDKVLGTDVKAVYCFCAAAASGVTYLNPSASRQGNAPHAMLLVDSDPFNSLIKILHTAVAAVPWKTCGVFPSHVEPDLQLGSGHVNQGNACHSWFIPPEAFLPVRAQARPHTSRRLQIHPSTGLFQIFLRDLESGFW